MWLRPPVSALHTSSGQVVDPSFGDGRQQIIEDQVHAAAAAHPGVLSILDLRGWLERSGLLDDPAARPDDMHLSEESATRVATEWLGPELLRLAGR